MTVTAQNYALVLGELNLDEQQIKAAETLLRENIQESLSWRR